jgi:hypothetical protein
MRMLGEKRKKFAPRAPLIGFALRRSIKGVSKCQIIQKTQNDDTHIQLITVQDGNVKSYMAPNRNIQKADNIERDDPKAQYDLEPHHTHVFLVEEVEEGKRNDGKNSTVDQSHVARARFEQVIRNREGNRRWAWDSSFKRHGELEKVPYVCVCIEGGIGCISQVYLIAKAGMSVLCVKGTGRASDFLGDLALLRFDDQDNNRYIPWKYKTKEHRNFCEFMNQVDREQQGSTSKAR